MLDFFPHLSAIQTKCYSSFSCRVLWRWTLQYGAGGHSLLGLKRTKEPKQLTATFSPASCWVGYAAVWLFSPRPLSGTGCAEDKHLPRGDRPALTGENLAAEASSVSHNVFIVFLSERTSDEKSGAAGAEFFSPAKNDCQGS